jgi:hypothetical protein
VPKVPKVKGTKMTITCFGPVFIGLKKGISYTIKLEGRFSHISAEKYMFKILLPSSGFRFSGIPEFGNRNSGESEIICVHLRPE